MANGVVFHRFINVVSSSQNFDAAIRKADLVGERLMSVLIRGELDHFDYKGGNGHTR